MRDRKRHWVFVVLVAVGLAAIIACVPTSPPDLSDIGSDGSTIGSDETVIDDSVVADELIVAAQPGADSNDLQALFLEYGVTVLDEIEPLSAYLLDVQPRQRGSVMSSLESSPLIEEVLDNRWYETQATPNDTLYAGQWHLTAIGMPGAWDFTTGSDRILIAVLDTGIDVGHADLIDKLRSGGNTFSGGVSSQDVKGHGTAVAGIIGASSNNNQGVASVAWVNPLLPVRVTDDQGRATSWAIAAGISLAINEGAKVINISFAPLNNDQIVLRQARRAWLAGSLVVIASGNTGVEDLEGGSGSALFVGAVDRNDQLCPFSTHGPWVDLVAPGIAIYSTKLGNDYSASSGTSFAAPIVSGVAALIYSLQPELRPITVTQLLQGTAVDLGPAGYDNSYGAGRVDAETAVRYAKYMVEQADETPPAIAIVTPTSGATLSERTKIEVAASDNIDVAEVSIYVDHLVRASDPIYPYAFVIDPAKFAAGRHEIKAVASDTSGNSAEQTIVLYMGGTGDTGIPSVTILSPAEATSVRNTVTVLADVSDVEGLSRVEVFVDYAVVSTIPLSGVESRIAYNWNTSISSVTAGSHTLTVRVYDTADNKASDSVHVTVVK